MSAEQAASAAVDASDTNADGTVSMDELVAALGQGDASSLGDAFAVVDADGDGGLSVVELTSAFQSLMAKQVESYGRQASADATSSLSVAA